MPGNDVFPNIAAAVAGDDRRLVLARGSRFALLLAVLWFGFYGLWASVPYVRPGAKILYDTKLQVIGRGGLFPEGAPVRIAVFGNSRTLSGFIPGRFDQRVGHGCSSFNFGLPDAQHFVGELERLVASGDAPTHVLLQVPWGSEDPDSLWHWIKEDRAVVNAAFPFRTFPRDLVVFAFLARRHGGIKAFYRESAAIAQQVIRDRGYYFIESQSHYPGHRLPDDYTFPSDHPDQVKSRKIDTKSPLFARLRDLVRAHDIQVILIPDHYRRHAYKEAPPTNNEAASALARYDHFHQLGPDYVSYENRDFADPVHLNPAGAERYTDLLADLFENDLERAPKKDAATPRPR